MESFSFCQGCAEILGGCGSGVFTGVEIDGEGGRVSGGTIEVDVETLLEDIVSYIFTYEQLDTHTHTHTHTHNELTYIPWIHKSVIKNVGCGASHKYTKYTNLQFQNTINIL